MSEQLHVWTNGSEFWIATSAEAARTAMNDQNFSGKGIDEELDGEDGEWSRVSDDMVIHVESENREDHCDKHETFCTAKAAAAWAADGPGFLCSTEG